MISYKLRTERSTRDGGSRELETWRMVDPRVLSYTLDRRIAKLASWVPWLGVLF